MPRKLRLVVAGLLIGVGITAVWGFMVFLADSGSPPPQPSGTPLIRSEFTLVDHTGRTRTEDDFGGRWQLAFFGFTHCPDVCPTTLSTISQLLDEMGADASKIAPLFITIDPDRDTPEAMAEYVEAIDPRVIGLTGSPEQINEAARAFRVYFARVGADGTATDYQMNHSTFVYLMDPLGRYAMHFSHHDDPAALAGRIREFLSGRKQVS